MSFHSLKEKYEKYERHVWGIALLCGFIFDNITLIRIDKPRDHIIIGSYLFLSLLGIIIVNLYEGGKLRDNKFVAKAMPWILFIMQFSLGGLFSNFTVLYSRSASFAESWPFVLALFLLLLGNEVFKKHYSRLTLHISTFFIALFSFTIFYVPILFGRMGDDIFVLSGVVSLGLVTALLFGLSKFIPERINENKKYLIASVGGIFLLVNVLYFTNIIPPIPLSLKDTGVYHSITRDADGEYSLSGEAERVFLFFRPKQVIHIVKGDSVYMFASVFAPTDLNATIVHLWQKYDDATQKWVQVSRVQFAIAGGRADGYRGYSVQENISEGLYRVDVETLRGQIIGREQFQVVYASSTPDLVTTVR